MQLRRAALALSAGSALGTAATGAWLSFFLRGQEYDLLRRAHLAFGGLLLSSLLVLVAGLIAALPSSRLTIGLPAMAGAAVVAAFAVWTGQRLGWRILGIWPAGPTEVRGIWTPAFDGGVRVVGLRGHSYSQASYQAIVLSHIAICPGLLAGYAVLVRVLGRRQDSQARVPVEGRA